MGGVISMLMPVAMLNTSIRIIQLFDILWKYNKCVKLGDSLIDDFINDTANTVDTAQIWNSQADLHTLEVNNNNFNTYLNELKNGIKTMLYSFEHGEDCDKNVPGFAIEICKLHFDYENIDSCLLYFTNTHTKNDMLETIMKKNVKQLETISAIGRSPDENNLDRISEMSDSEYIQILNLQINILASFVCIIEGYLSNRIGVDMMQHCIDKFNIYT